MFAKLADEKEKKDILNPHLDWQSQNESNLHNSVIKEFIFNHGIAVRYLRRIMFSPDFVFGEDPNNQFGDAFKCSVYLESFDKYEGMGSQFTSFGYTMKDEAEFIINIDQFKEQGDGSPPLEGDLIYIPMTNSLFEIKNIDPEDVFYQFGNLPVRRMMTQKFTYSHEEFNTDVYDAEEGTIDIVNQLLDLNQLDDFSESERKQVEDEDGFIEFDPSNPFGNGYDTVRGVGESKISGDIRPPKPLPPPPEVNECCDIDPSESNALTKTEKGLYVPSSGGRWASKTW